MKTKLIKTDRQEVLGRRRPLTQVTVLSLDCSRFGQQTKRKSKKLGAFLAHRRCSGNPWQPSLSKGRDQAIL
jgi:hypothetical protein